MTCRTRSRRRGYFIIDIAFALALLATLMAILAASNTQNRRAIIALGERRAAVRQAEDALLRLRMGERMEGVAVDAMPGIAGAPAGWRWVTARATHGRGEVSLVGLVPAAPSEAPAEVEATP